MADRLLYGRQAPIWQTGGFGGATGRTAYFSQLDILTECHTQGFSHRGEKTPEYDIL